MSDILVKCTRCRHSCMLSDWVGVRSKRYVGCTELVCRNCGCKSYYDMHPQVVWCWANGVIEIGDAMPANSPDGGGAIKVAEGPKSELDLAIGILARHSHTRGVFLVPGVPEAADGNAAVDALSSWLKWCQGSKRRGSRWPGVVWASKGGA